MLDFFCIQGGEAPSQSSRAEGVFLGKVDREKKKVGIEANEWHFVAVVKEVGGFSNSPGSCQAVCFNPSRLVLFFIRNLKLKERNDFYSKKI